MLCLMARGGRHLQLLREASNHPQWRAQLMSHGVQKSLHVGMPPLQIH
jgi:hypothetical protein